MRLPLAVPVSLLATSAFAVAPAVSLARHIHHPHHNRGLTIRVTENPIVDGDSILIYGRTTGNTNAGQQVNLYHHIAGSQRGYTIVQRTTTLTGGFYEFIRPAGVVDSNRSFFVTTDATPLGRDHSRTVFERVHARVTINAPTTAFTNQNVAIVGQVAPNHASERVLLERQIGGARNDFRVVGTTRLDASSNYRFVERSRIARDYTLRVVFPGDRRNLAGVSDEVSIAVSQNQNPAFTLNASANPITVGQGDMLTGTLAASATQSNSNVAVTLFQRAFNSRVFTVAQNGTTDASGNYTFTVQPANNTVYSVRTASGQHTRQLFLGVRDSVTITPSSTTSTVAGSVTFTGTVAPTKVGHSIELQRQGPDGDYFTVATSRLGSTSSYSFTRTFGTPGMKVYRVRETGGPDNEGGVSPSLTITVSPPTLSSLPAAS